MTELSNKFNTRILFVAIVVAYGLALFFSSKTNGDFWWFDSSRHALNGVFVCDFILDGGFLHPIEYASEYYRQYPGINIGFYPPFFYLSSAPFLAIFGENHAVSQAVVALYAVMAGIFTYYICVVQTDRLTAVAIALCVLALPEMAQWSRQVQLDVPAIGLLLATAFFLIRHLECGSTKWMFFTGVCLGLSVLTRVQALYAVPAIIFFLFFCKYPQRPAMKLRFTAIFVGGLIALPSVLMVAYFSQLNQSLAVQMPGMPRLLSIDNWLWYIAVLPQQMGWPALIISVVGLAAGAIAYSSEGMSQRTKVLLGFFTCSWIFFSIVSNKEPRFNLPSLPFLFMFSALGLYKLTPALAKVALPSLAIWLVFQSIFISNVPVVSGFKEAALVAQKITPRNENVLISAHRDGSFIYNMRTLGDRRDIGVRRADKLLVEIQIMRELGIKDRNLREDEIEELLRNEKVSTIVAQTDYLSDQKSMQNFQRLLTSGRLFEQVQVIQLEGATTPSERELVIYKKK